MKISETFWATLRDMSPKIVRVNFVLCCSIGLIDFRCINDMKRMRSWSTEMVPSLTAWWSGQAAAPGKRIEVASGLSSMLHFGSGDKDYLVELCNVNWVQHESPSPATSSSSIEAAKKLPPPFRDQSRVQCWLMHCFMTIHWQSLLLVFCETGNLSIPTRILEISIHLVSFFFLCGACGSKRRI